MVKKYWRVLVAVVVLVAALTICAIKGYCEVYTLSSGGTKSISWEAPAGETPDSYNYYFLQMESGRIFGRGAVGVPSTIIRFRTIGTYSLWVQACRGAVGAQQCGGWAQSTDPAFGFVNGVQAPWLIRVVP